MKKQSISVLCAGLLALTGCRNHKKRTVDTDEAVITHNAITSVPEVTRSRIFDDNEQAFVLEEQDNPFVPEGTVRLEEGGSLWSAQEQERFNTIYFNFDQYKIRADQKPALERVRAEVEKLLRADNKAVVVVEGHSCNSAGSTEYNFALSDDRARSVRDYLVQQGVPKERLKVVGRGFEMRKVACGNRDQQAPNRRVEFHLIVRSEK